MSLETLLRHYWKPRMWFYAISTSKITIYVKQQKLQQYSHLLNTFYKEKTFHTLLFKICSWSTKVLFCTWNMLQNICITHKANIQIFNISISILWLIENNTLNKYYPFQHSFHWLRMCTGRFIHTMKDLILNSTQWNYSN